MVAPDACITVMVGTTAVPATTDEEELRGSERGAGGDGGF
jgi:hypothetical protein